MEGFRDSQLTPPIPNMPYTLNHASDQARGLVAWWPLDDLDGYTVENRVRAGDRGKVGNISTGVVNSVRPTYIDGALGIRITDNGGLGNHITTGFADQLGDFTACIWFRHTASTFFGRIMDKDQGVLNTGFRMEINNALPDLEANIFGTNILLTGVASAGVNFHGVVRRQGTAGAFILNAGRHKATATVASTTLSTSALGIGASSGGNNQSQIELRDARIYNRALSDDEIAGLYNPVTRYELYSYLGQRPYGLPLGSATPVSGRSQVIVIG